MSLCLGCFAGEEYKDKVALEEEYEKLSSMLLQKKKTLKNVQNEIHVSVRRFGRTVTLL